MSRTNRNGNNANHGSNSRNGRTSRGVEMQKSSGSFSTLLKYAANLSFNNPLGEPLHPLDSQNAAASAINFSTGLYADCAIPGIMTVDVVPSAGVSRSAGATVNVAVNRIYGRTRYENSGSTNYDNVDEYIYISCVSSLHLMYHWLRRIYGRLRTFMNWNRYSAPIEMQVHGFSWDDLSKKMPQFAALLDIMKAQVAVFKVPTDFRMIDSQIGLYSRIFKDSPLEKAQYIIFRPAGFYKFALDAEGKGMAKFVALDYSTPLTFDAIQQMINSFISPILADNDFNIMSGDIYKAYGTTYELPDISSDYMVEAEYDYDVLHALENSTILPDVKYWVNSDIAPAYNLDITQAVDDMLNPYIVFQPTFRVNTSGSVYTAVPGFELKSMLNAHDDVPDPGVVANMCRWKVIARPGVDISEVVPNTLLYAVTSTGTEFLTNCRVWYIDAARTLQYAAYASYMLAKIEMIEKGDLLTAFNAHPRITYVKKESAANTYTLVTGVSEIDNYTWVDADALNKIQEAFIMNQYSLLDSKSF